MDTGYCVKCRAKDREMKDTKIETFTGKGGERRALRGVCVVCGTKMMKFLPKK